MKRFMLLLVLTAAALAQQQPPFTDERDNKSYRAVKIGEQVWMAENLNYKVGGSQCYENKEENCDKYGRLYTWYAAKTACPSGWHLPSNAEWNVLYKFVDSGYVENHYSKVAGDYLKAKSGWNEETIVKIFEGIDHEFGNGEDKFGFAALPGGNGYSTPPAGSFHGNVGDIGYWWSASEYNDFYVYYRTMYYLRYNDKLYLRSVRCVRD